MSKSVRDLEAEVAQLRAALKQQTMLLQSIVGRATESINSSTPLLAEKKKKVLFRTSSNSLKEMLTGEIKQQNYEEVYEPSGEVLGTGMTGSVFVVQKRNTKKRFACKKLKKSGLNASKMANLRKEVNIMAMLDHPNIIKLVDAFEDRNYLVIISELCTGGELYDHLISAETYTQQVAAGVFKQMVVAVNFCHQHGIVHRDLKLENFIITGESGRSLHTL